ncbi:hypothetical protein AQUCO_03300096v1 [Aquilegia coerulea]|uniref:Uncharacterized protein n=1 Tax=Aquilegia coerulea TaxID=218851 RepID=A0A2G5CZF5_AQUCA|nr:hypothetical protein AQUCO_03300096v1 [Aquilegia coerulea]
MTVVCRISVTVAVYNMLKTWKFGVSDTSRNSSPAERTLVLYQLKPLILKDKTLGQMLKWKKTNLIYRQHSQGKIIRARTVSRERVVDLCSSAQEVGDLQIQARRYRPGQNVKDVNGEHQAQGRLGRERTTTNVRSVATASEGEHNDLIGSKLHQMQHGSRTLSEEKNTVRDINMFVSTKEKSTANETTNAETQYTQPLCGELLACKKAIEDGIKVSFFLK